MIYEYMQNSLGGLLLWPLFFVSFVATLLIVERCLYWFQIWLFKNPKLRQKLLQRETQIGTLEKQNIFGDPVVQVLWEYHREGLNKAKVIGQRRIEETRKFLPTLSLLGSISTSLGLFGTVVGVSISFRSMSMTDSQGVAMGLSAALYTTIVGIAIFLTVSLFLHFFRSLSEGFQKDLESYLLNLHLKGEYPNSRDFSSQGETGQAKRFSLTLSLLVLILTLFFCSWLWSQVAISIGEEIPMAVPIMGLIFAFLVIFLYTQNLLPSYLGSRFAFSFTLASFFLGNYFSHSYFYQIHRIHSLGVVKGANLSPFSVQVIHHYIMTLLPLLRENILWLTLALGIAWLIPWGFENLRKIGEAKDALCE